MAPLSENPSASPVPIALPPNQPADRPYLGGLGIARFRGLGPEHNAGPEDFLASTTEVWAGGGVGLTRLSDGRLLRDAVRAAPQEFLGADHVARYGDEVMLLVKLLDTGERLFAHFHPGDSFAGDALGAPRGKTEAWIVIDTDPAHDPYALLGFSRDVDPADVVDWFDRQDVAAITAAMNRLPLAVGDTLLVPAGVPHVIGPGITLVEVQQPADLSLLLEYRGFGDIDREGALLGLDATRAFDGLRHTRFCPDECVERAMLGPGTRRLLPPSADDFFRAWWIDSRTTKDLRPGFAVLVVVEGDGTLRWDGGELSVSRGSTVLLPHASGTVHCEGSFGAILCAPPGREAP
ncbi:class I mannose-6-phosphate isomerase [Microbacterium sp. NPDC058342]|uniref:class I mannose-6-phosphate isomerase n=1 Tax=Microbacterium sp. NPDC058342 TaxID=3346454 RepID=UPI003653737D